MSASEKRGPETTGPGAGPNLALIVGSARSGTTLTRLLMDAHPEIGCPAEAAIPALLTQMARAWLGVHADQLPGVRGRKPKVPAAPTDEPAGLSVSERSPATAVKAPPFAQLSPRARDWLVRTVSVPMADYCSEHGKRIYCDKSINSVNHLPLVRELFPELRSVMVFRHVMDMVASGLEASPWGLTHYGFRPFVEAASGNTVAALANYWLSHAQRALAWEAAYPDECLRVRYEDLVLTPDETLRSVFDFLGVQADDAVLERAFARAQRSGPSDHKIGHTSGVHTDSLGRGKRVPVEMIPPPLLREVNRTLVRLGYEAVGEAWNTQAGGTGSAGDRVWSVRLTEVMGSARLEPADGVGSGNVALIADDQPGLRWVVDPMSGTVTRGDGDADQVVIGAAEDLVLMIAGEENPGILLRDGRVRHIATGTTVTEYEQLHRALHWIISELRESAEAARAWTPEGATHSNPISRPSAAWI